MKTLKEMVDNYAPFGMSDMEIIKNYLIENEFELEALEMIPALAKSRAERYKTQLNFARTWIPNQIDMSEQIKDKIQLRVWNAIVNYFSLSMDLPNHILALAQAVIPETPKPKYYFVPAYEWLNREYNIYFKGDKPNDNK